MGFKKINYNSGENFLEIRIKQGRDSIIDKWKIMMSDLPKWFTIIKNKYGIGLQKKQTDLDWAK